MFFFYVLKYAVLLHLNILNLLTSKHLRSYRVWLHSMNITGISMMSKLIYKLVSDWLVQYRLIGPPLNTGVPVYLWVDP